MNITRSDRQRDYTLLIVDDDEVSRELMSTQFERAGYRILLAETGFEALYHIDHSHVDLVLLDIMMPGISGLDVVEQIREHHSLINLPVIMVTADDHAQSVVTSLQLGANDYLTKPLNLAVALARIKTQLALKDLAELKSEFVRFASHDLKKPLIVMMDIASELEQICVPGEKLNADVPELLDLILRTGDNMEKVIHGFLGDEPSSRVTSELKYETVSLNDIVDKSLQTNETYARKKGVKLNKDQAADLPLLEADVFRLCHVLDNLIGNAIKFSPRDTVTTVRTYADERFAYAEVIDEGPGLTEEDMGQIFTRYAKLSNRPTGDEHSSGIGLAMSKQFIELHEGEIGARNNPQRGATFWFRVPLRSSSQADG